MLRSSGRTLAEVAAVGVLLAVTTLTLATAMTCSAARDEQSRERAWARRAAEAELAALAALPARELAAYATPRDFVVGEDLNRDGVLAHSERLVAAPLPDEVPARTEAGRASVDLSYPGVARAVVSVRWRSATGEPQELLLRAQLALERTP